MNPLDVVAEILGEPADQMRNPANADYRCPFRNGPCIKFSKTLEAPAPVCSVHQRHRKTDIIRRPPICTCPVRFFESDIPGDVIRECWVGPKPENTEFVYEVQMQKFGKVDLVITELSEKRDRVKSFLPVELQAVDITGTVLPAYIAITNNQAEISPAAYGLNWANVRKRFISQLIAKGYYCHHWGTRIIAVVQEELFERFQAHAKSPEVAMKDSNIVFMLYQYVWNEAEKRWQFSLKRVVPTTHVNVMNAILYETPPSKAVFEAKLLNIIKSS